MNTFGYGDDHDPEIMNQLANIRDGSFFYVQDYKKVSEYFVTVLGGCVSIISKNVKVSIKLLNEHSQISKIFGEKDLYNHELELHIFKTEILQLLCDKEYTYVMEIKLDEKKFKKGNEILYVEVIYKDMNNNRLKKKTFIYKYESKQINKEKANEEYVRSQVYYILNEALKLREKNKVKEANVLLTNMEDWIKKNYKGNNKFYLEDIQNAKTLFKDEKTFIKKGKAFAKSNIKQKIQKKIGANDMYKNCNMEYYCSNMVEEDFDIDEKNSYNDYNNFNKSCISKKNKNNYDDYNIDENDNNFDYIDNLENENYNNDNDDK